MSQSRLQILLAPGCVSVPLFNQKKRNRIPLTSTPSENKFFSHTEFMPSTISATHGASGAYQASSSSSDSHPSQQWNKQDKPPPQHGSYRPAPTMRSYTPIVHPYKFGQSSNPVKQDDSRSVVTSRQTQYQTSTVSQQRPHFGFSQTSQQSAHTQFRPLPPPVQPPSALAAQTKQLPNKWNFTNSFGPQNSIFVGKKKSNKPQTRTPKGENNPKETPFDNSLRILTAVIDGMRHWSQFKDKVPHFFEIFATLDSAVTLGRHGSKNFLLRDGKEVVQCIFYENEQELPRLIRGQVHRCVGNYDRRQDVLVCVSVRSAQPSEVRNGQEAIKACDAHMRKLVRLLCEV
ncbi:spermatogenesis-associated protein 22 isoform X2 [Dunckerocampus dactyliophorus]|uniref:spermatogenesis-associated protein 22 isoform X2 n=1 Tax=Dunckerocampus dactyliophorus TaxID=161453 RepID=UPI002405A0FE|nr:spermatogenesis-associated protein 22 isoform X2 [Dunckerocampus dactyliophorus]